MAVNLDNLSPKELQAVIADANAKMKNAHSNLILDVRKKFDQLLSNSGLTLADVYPTRGGKKGSTRSVAPKYRNPADPSKTWSGRGKQPLWFADAVKKRGVTAESLLIDGSTITTKAPVKATKQAVKKATKKAIKKTATKKTTKA